MGAGNVMCCTAQVHSLNLLSVTCPQLKKCLICAWTQQWKVAYLPGPAEKIGRCFSYYSGASISGSLVPRGTLCVTFPDRGLILAGRTKWFSILITLSAIYPRVCFYRSYDMRKYYGFILACNTTCKNILGVLLLEVDFSCYNGGKV